MIVVYSVEPILNGYVAKVAGDWGSGVAQSRSRNRAIGSAVVLALTNIARGVDDGTVALADALSIQFEEALSDARSNEGGSHG